MHRELLSLVEEPPYSIAISMSARKKSNQPNSKQKTFASLSSSAKLIQKTQDRFGVLIHPATTQKRKVNLLGKKALDQSDLLE